LIAGQPPAEDPSVPPSGDDAAGQDTDAPPDAPPDGPTDGPAEEDEDAGDDGPPETPDDDTDASPAGDGEGEGEGEASDVGNTDTEAAGELTPAGELDMEDIFGDTEELDLEELPEDGGPTADTGKGGLLPEGLDARLRIVSSAYFDIDDYGETRRWDPDYPDRGRISRQENRVELYLSYQPNRHIQIVGDIEPVFMGVSDVSTLDDLASRRMLTPFHVESDAAYVAVYDALPGLDVKIGRQVLLWGTADKFNPTNNLNPDDLEDRPLFTEPIANQMIVADFAPLDDRLWFEAVYIPLFFPALLPPSSSAALQDPKSIPPYLDQANIDKIAEAQDFMDTNECFTTRVVGRVEQPEAHVENGQAAFKVGSRLGQLDLSASYYYGRHDIPLPYNTKTNQLFPCNDPMNVPDDGVYYQADAYLRYPRMHVVGLDFATQLPFLGNMGVWGEGGLFMPTQSHSLLIQFPIPIDVTPDDGIANSVTEVDGITVPTDPFLKVTAGLDYTLGKHVYLNGQYVRGFINEFGSSNMGNYLVAGTDLIFFGRHLIFRLFGVTEFPDARSDQYAAAIAPDIIVVPPWGYVTLELGGFALLGSNKSTLAQRGAGSSIVYFKVAGQF
jgi:hypothetical protein